MLNIIQAIFDSETQVLNLYGPPKSGKSELIKALTYELTSRNSYTDGIYLVQLKNIISNQQKIQMERAMTGNTGYGENSFGLKDLLKPIFGDSFDHNMQIFFKKKKMLIIMDDWKEITNIK